MRFIYNNQDVFGPMGPAGPDGNPIGAVLYLTGTRAPENYLVCEGGQYNISDYPELAGYFKGQFGAANYFGGDGVSTFGLPSIPVPEAGGGLIPCIKAAAAGESPQNIYSYEEKFVGYWTNGERLYRKMAVVSPPAASDGMYEIYTIEDGCRIVNFDAIITETVDNSYSVFQKNNFTLTATTMDSTVVYRCLENRRILARVGANWQKNTGITLILEYTKGG